MAIHWTDYPERVETFGDLLCILETLHRDHVRNRFHFESFANETPQSAYSVEIEGSTYRFEPRLDGMPDLERLLIHFDLAHIPTLNLNQFQGIQGQIAATLRIDRSAVNALTFTQIADALDAKSLGIPRVPPASTPAMPRDSGVKTLGDLLASVRSVEQAAAQARAVADSMNDAPGTGHWRIQAGVYEATAEHKNHPAFSMLEGYVNSHFGPVTYENLIRVRGVVCQARRCATTEADRLELEEVIRTLGCSGEASSAPANLNPAPIAAVQDVGPYTLNDICDLVRYRQARTEYRTRLLSLNPGDVFLATHGKTLGISPVSTLKTVLALVEPQPPRMTEDEVVTQPVYHWLVRAARADNAELNEETLRLLVGRVAMATKRPVPELMGLPLDDFDRVRRAIPGEVDSGFLQPVATPNPVRTPRDEPPRNPQPPGVAADLDSVTWNLSNIFTQAVDLAESLDCEHDRTSASGDPDRIAFQLRRALNPQCWPLRFEFKNGANGELLPGWLPSIRVATCLCADTKRVLESLALIACDVDGAIEAFPHDPEELDDPRYATDLDTARRRLRYARSLLGSSAAALWVVMDGDEREEVAGHIQTKARRLFRWPEMPTELPGGLQRYDDHIRNFDDGGAEREYRLWRTVRLSTIPHVAPDVIPVTSPTDPKDEGGNLVPESQTNPSDPQEATKFVFASMGSTYLLAGFGEAGHLPSSLKGLGVIARLVRTPGVPVPWAELDTGILKADSRTPQPTYDETALKDLREKCLRLQTEIETADDEIERADSQRQLDELTAHLLPAIGLQGKARDMNNLTDKLRPKIWGRINTVNEKLRQAMPPMPNMAKHFEECITSTTDGFLYNPPAPVPQWQTEPDKK
jgi:hypothetical protein